MKEWKRVIKDRKGKLNIEPKFFNRGCYFYFIPKKFLNKIEEGKTCLFKFGPPKWKNNKTDKNGKKIYICAAIPIKE